jgi:MFS family permease
MKYLNVVKSTMNKYLIITAVYRFICGGLILAINWELANPKSTIDLALATILSFIPAIFIPFIIAIFFKKQNGSTLTKLAMLAIFFIVLSIALSYKNTILLIILNFILWTAFFLIETSLEYWFSEIVSDKDELFINKYSSISMTTNQVALMIGPLFLSLIVNYIDLTWLFLIYGVIYLLLCLAINNTKCIESHINNTDNTSSKNSVKIIHYLISMLMWPVLGSINFMLPIFTAYRNGAIHHVALLDSALGIGMAGIGILLSKYFNYKWIDVFIIISIVNTVLWYFADSLTIKLLLMLLFGFSFGGARILFRKIIVTAYSSTDIKKIYSIGNALSLPILAISIFIGITNLNLVWLPSFILLLILLILLKIIKKGHLRN